MTCLNNIIDTHHSFNSVSLDRVNMDSYLFFCWSLFIHPPSVFRSIFDSFFYYGDSIVFRVGEGKGG